MTSVLFDFVARLQGPRPWGRVLDSGAGVHSAGWLSGRPTESLTLVSAAPEHARQVAAATPLRAQDTVRVGNWADPAFLRGERFDTVLADYLIGAVDGFSPYAQDVVIRRVAAACRGRLYVVGLEPYILDRPNGDAGALLGDIGRYRDACLLLSGERPYREFPAEWVAERLVGAGMRVLAARRFPIRYKAAFIESQLRMAEMRLDALADVSLGAALKREGRRLHERAARHIAEHGTIRHGHDYVIAAEPTG